MFGIKKLKQKIFLLENPFKYEIGNVVANEFPLCSFDIIIVDRFFHNKIKYYKCLSNKNRTVEIEECLLGSVLYSDVTDVIHTLDALKEKEANEKE